MTEPFNERDFGPPPEWFTWIVVGACVVIGLWLIWVWFPNKVGAW